MIRRAFLFGVLGWALMAPSPAGAHPLGNFSTNQLAQVSISDRDARISYILDLAEIPSFQLVQRYDADGDGAIAGTERAPLGDELVGEIAPELELDADGRPIALGSPQHAELGFPAGQAGLSLTRLELDYRVALPAGIERVELANTAFENRVGWRAIQVLSGEGTDVVSNVPATDPTNGLRDYPEGLLDSPSSVTEASFEVSPGTGSVSAPDGSAEGSESGPSAGSGGFAAALAGGDTEGLLILVLLASAFGWGALHALSPGHGKLMVVGYLTGSRATPRHALLLGGTVTATHTASVFLLGAVTLAASELIVPERLYPWLGIASGLIVVGVGLNVMRSRFRRWRTLRAGGDAAAEATAHDHHHGHDHHHHGHDHHHHGHDHHHHDGHGYHHGHGHHHHEQGTTAAARGRAPVRIKELLGLGVSGGLVPCPSALVVLIAAISQHRIGLGLVLIFAFSLGLAATVSGIGLMTIYGQGLLGRLRPERRLFAGRVTGALPAVSASLIVAVGVLITSRAIPELG